MEESRVTILSCPPIYDLIFSCLDYPDLIHISKTCRTARKAVSYFCLRAYNINKHLSHFFNDPIAFRNLQARTSSLISGSNVLQFLDRTYFEDADLDIFVHHIHSQEVGHWILAEGYEFVPTVIQSARLDKSNPSFEDVEGFSDLIESGSTEDEISDYPLGSLVANVFTFQKEDKKVQLIGTIGSPMPCVLAFHCTCVMNFFTHDRAYSLYPKATFISRKTVGVKARSKREKDGLKKYASRGWEVITQECQIRRSELKGLFFLNKERHPRDEYCWQVPFSIEDIEPRYLCQHNPALYNSWVMERPLKTNDYSDYIMSSSYVLKHRALSNTYRVESRWLEKALGKLVKTELEGVRRPLRAPIEARIYKVLGDKFDEYFNIPTADLEDLAI
ncbi:hypothetical protein BDQ17DRAFT_1272684 [Cyathus striatus]|nr:hypothetical protein BDQ17DRAFT_1272684 [Cyathus striatus]